MEPKGNQIEIKRNQKEMKRKPIGITKMEKDVWEKI